LRQNGGGVFDGAERRFANMPYKRTVLVALTDTLHGFFRGIGRYAKEHNWHLVTDMIHTSAIPHGWRGDGIISFVGYHRDDLADFIVRSPLPKVELTLTRSDLDLPHVDADNIRIGELAAEHFLARNFKNFGWLCFKNSIIGEERLCGFRRTLQKQGADCILLSSAHGGASPESELDWNWDLQRQHLLTVLRHLPLPIGIFCYNDCVAANLVDACEEAGLLVPEEVAIMGVDNDPLICECVSVPLSSVVNDLEGMAYAGAALLDRLMDGEAPPQDILRVPPKGVITRKSTDILAVSNVAVAKALRFIWEHYAENNLSVDDVVAVTGFSRRTLERAFSAEMRHSIQKEILRVRMEKVHQLLVSTDMTVADISEQTGFSRPNHLFRVFRTIHRMNPRVWRGMQQKIKSRTAGGDLISTGNGLSSFLKI
jgi:LacI family transcriptional regulator